MYQGHTNYETWAVKLWIDNEQASQEYWQERASECMDMPDAQYTLADWIKDETETLAPEIEGVYSDLLSAALSSVNWREIAEGMIDIAKENQEGE